MGVLYGIYGTWKSYLNDGVKDKDPSQALLFRAFILPLHKFAHSCNNHFTFAVFWIDRFYNGDRGLYSFVSMLISLSNLAAMGKVQKNN